MKKLLLICVGLCFCIGIFAQNCNYEQIDTLIGDYQIKITKKEDLGVDLSYSVFGKRKNHSIFIYYPNFSDYVLFPDTAIAELTSTGVKKYYKLYLYDDILIVPVIGIGSDRLKMFIINLKNKKILSDFVGTGFDWIWLKNENGLYVITFAIPILNDDDKYDYTIFLHKITQNGFYTIKEKNIELEENIRFYFDINAQQRLIENIRW